MICGQVLDLEYTFLAKTLIIWGLVGLTSGLETCLSRLLFIGLNQQSEDLMKSGHGCLVPFWQGYSPGTSPDPFSYRLRLGESRSATIGPHRPSTGREIPYCTRPGTEEPDYLLRNPRGP